MEDKMISYEELKAKIDRCFDCELQNSVITTIAKGLYKLLEQKS
jgi:hypothetical protein